MNIRAMWLTSALLIAFSVAGFPASAQVGAIPESVIKRIDEKLGERDQEEYERQKDIVEAALANPSFYTPDAEALLNEAEGLADADDLAGAMTKLRQASELIEGRKNKVKTQWVFIAYLICFLFYFGYIGCTWARMLGMQQRLKRKTEG